MRVPNLACVLSAALLTGAARAEVLDSFTSNVHFAGGHYTFISVFNGGGNDPQVAGGELQINTSNGIGDTFATSAFVWNQGQKLRFVGDSATIELRFDGGPLSASSTHVGLYLTDTLGPGGNHAEVNMGRTFNDAYLMQIVDLVDLPLSGTPVGNSLLTVEVTGAGASLTMLATLSGSGFTTVSHGFSVAAPQLFFGPVAFDTDGTNGAHDNFGFTAAPSLCPADCGDHNGIVGVIDFLALLNQWGQVGTPCDLNGNGVNAADFLGLLQAWGPCPVAGCGPEAGSCCFANGSPGCQEPACCAAICTADPFCCDTDWDGLCASAALASPQCSCTADPCGPGTGDCCIANGSPGCEDAACCQAVCATDPFCCDTDWDGMCANEAQGMCNCP